MDFWLEKFVKQELREYNMTLVKLGDSFSTTTSQFLKLPTARAQEPGRTTEGYAKSLKDVVEGKEQIKRKAPQVTDMLRTPDANMECGRRTAENLKGRLDRGMPLNLNDQLDAMEYGLLPTPMKEGFDAGPHRGSPDTLHSRIKMLLTPKANAANTPGRHGQGGQDLQTVVDEQTKQDRSGTGPGMKLQPNFVEHLMGYPMNWTRLED